MRSFSRADLGDRLLGVLPAAATATTEGAWVGVIYAALQIGWQARRPELEVWAFVVAAAIGLAASRRIRGRRSWLGTAAVTLLAGVAGWASDPIARDALWRLDVAHVIGAHATGTLLALAAWRGTRHGDAQGDDLVVGSLLARMVPGLTVPWLVGTAGPGSRAFVGAALSATLLFVAAGLIATGLTRLDALGRAAGVDWRGNRTWLALLGSVVMLVAMVGTPIALLLGTSLSALVGSMFNPVLQLLRVLTTIAAPVGEALGRIIGSARGVGPPVQGGPAEGGITSLPSWLGNAVAVGIGLTLVVGAGLVWRRARGGRSSPPPGRQRSEERRIALPALALRFPRPHLKRPRFVRRHDPVTATEAYLALLRQLAGDDRTGRRPAETPAGHARRLRRGGLPSLPMDLLAADYQLERYGSLTLTGPEVRRAIGRWRRVRRSKP